MTVLELVQRDFRKAENALVAAMKRPNIPEKELAHIEHLLELRASIVEIVAEHELECPLGGDETDDCADCPYAGDYHFVDGECLRREEE